LLFVFGAAPSSPPEKSPNSARVGFALPTWERTSQYWRPQTKQALWPQEAASAATRYARLDAMEIALKRALFVLLLFALVPVRAEWLKVVETSENTVVYVDSQIAESDGDLRRVSELHDHKSPLTKGNVSTRYLSEYNCQARRLHRLQVDEFSEHMAQGKLRSTKIGSEEPWIPVQPDTTAEAVLKYVCGR